MTCNLIITLVLNKILSFGFTLQSSASAELGNPPPALLSASAPPTCDNTFGWKYTASNKQDALRNNNSQQRCTRESTNFNSTNSDSPSNEIDECELQDENHDKQRI
jgi:hypothetical protein